MDPLAEKGSTSMKSSVSRNSVSSPKGERPLPALPADVREISERMDRFTRQADEFQRCVESIIDALSSFLNPNSPQEPDQLADIQKGYRQ
jgi:hypothetical protein